MRLLLDENLPHQMRLELPGHDVFTAAYMGWAGVENGELLRLAAADGFDALVTNDRGLEYQQNLDELPLAVVVVLTLNAFLWSGATAFMRAATEGYLLSVLVILGNRARYALYVAAPVLILWALNLAAEARVAGKAGGAAPPTAPHNGGVARRERHA